MEDVDKKIADIGREQDGCDCLDMGGEFICAKCAETLERQLADVRSNLAYARSTIRSIRAGTRCL